MFKVTASAIVLLVCLIQLTSCDEVDRNPKNFVRAWDDAIPLPLFEKLKEDVVKTWHYEEKLPILESYRRRTRWFPTNTPPRTTIEQAILYLKRFVKPPPEFIGCEWWVQKVAANKEIGFHIDKDEAIAVHQSRLVHPLFASIVYVTNTGGPTLIIEQYSPDGNNWEPENPRIGTLVFPKERKFAVFDGDLLHGVLEGHGDPNDIRITFLVNWWAQKPLEPNCLLLPYDELPELKIYKKRELWRMARRAKDEEDYSKNKPIKLDMRDSAIEKYDYTFNLFQDTYQHIVPLPTKLANGETVGDGYTYFMRWRGTE